MQIRIKQRRKQRAGREEGEEKKKKNRDRNKVYVSGWPPSRFSISAGQRERANMIFSPTRQQKTDREGREGGDRKERGWGEEEKRKGMSKWKKMGKRGMGGDL